MYLNFPDAVRRIEYRLFAMGYTEEPRAAIDRGILETHPSVAGPYPLTDEGLCISLYLVNADYLSLCQ